MKIKGYIDHLCGETPTDLRMGVPASTTKCGAILVCTGRGSSPIANKFHPFNIHALGVLDTTM
jgi:hypothetical protein